MIGGEQTEPHINVNFLFHTKGGVTPLFGGAGTMVFILIKSSGAGASGAMVPAPT